MRKRTISILLTLILAIAALAGCGSGGTGGSGAGSSQGAGSNAAAGSETAGKVRIGSKDFTENEIVAELYSLALEDAGYDVTTVFDISSSLIHQSIVSDEIDLYPEYTGTGLLSILQEELITDPDEVYNEVKEKYEEKFQLTWLDYAYTTEGQLSQTDKFVLLEDDKQVWPPYNLAPVVRDNVLADYPVIADILNKVSATLDTQTITDLNAKVDVDKQEYEDVAKEYWESIKDSL